MKRLPPTLIIVLAGLILFSIAFSHNQEVTKRVYTLRSLGIGVPANEGWLEYIWKPRPNEAFADDWALEHNGGASQLAMRQFGIETVYLTRYGEDTTTSVHIVLKLNGAGKYEEASRKSSEYN